MAAPARVNTPEPVSCQLTGNGRNGRSCENASVAPVQRRMLFHHSDSGIRKAATPAVRSTVGRRTRAKPPTRTTAKTADRPAPYSIDPILKVSPTGADVLSRSSVHAHQ